MAFRIWLQSQLAFFSVLLLLFVLPLGLFFQFSPYPAPKIQYVFLGGLFIFGYLRSNEKSYRKSISGLVIEQLKKENGKLPAQNLVAQREELIVKLRMSSIVIAGIMILGIMFWYNKF
jgi:hypothetical protein